MKPRSYEKVQAVRGTFRVLVVGALLAVGLAQSARATTLYTYTGNPFTIFSGNDSCVNGVGECYLSGTITVATPIPADTYYDLAANNSPYSWTDGFTTLNNSNSSYLPGQAYLETNQTGQIFNWDFSIQTQAGYTFSSYNVSGNRPGDYSAVQNNSAFNFYSPGVWQETTAPAPEASTNFLLLVSGLLGCGTMVLHPAHRRCATRKALLEVPRISEESHSHYCLYWDLKT